MTERAASRDVTRTQGRRWRPLVGGCIAVLVLAVVLGVAGAAARDTTHRPERVYLFGDSLVLQASPYLQRLLGAAGFDAQTSSFAGTNTCDWFTKMAQVSTTVRPDVVVISFGGNNLTKCMHHPDGSPYTGTAFAQKFAADTEHAVAIFPRTTTIYLVDPPAMFNGDNRFTTAYRTAAATHPNVRFVDGGSILTPGRQWTRTLPCAPHEQCDGPVVHGVRTVIVRAADKIHFCPVTASASESCPVYSPGAYRYALTIVDALDRKR